MCNAVTVTIKLIYVRRRDNKRAFDCDIAKALPETRKLHHVRNTTEPLTLQVRNTACLCRKQRICGSLGHSKITTEKR